MFSDFYHAFYYIILIVASIGGLLLFFKTDSVYRWIASLMMITLLSELSAKYIAYIMEVSNSAIYHVFVPIEFIMYAIIFSKFMESKSWNKVLIGMSIFIILAEIFNTNYLQPLNESNTNTMILESVLLVFLSLMLFLRIKESVFYDNLLIEGIFWFNSGVLMYYAFNILVWGFHSIKIYNLVNPPNIIYSINLFFCGLLYLTYAISIYLNYKFTHQVNLKRS